MLASELKDVAEKGRKVEGTICAGVYRDPNPDTSVTSPAVLDMLRSDFPEVELISYSEIPCADRLLLFASDAGESPNWMAGFTCGGLCGWGHGYEVEIERNEVSVEATSTWIS